MRFLDKWSSELWPKIQADFERLSLCRPCKQDAGAVGGHYGSRTLELIKVRKELRNVACNLAWTGPAANTPLHKDITYEVVETFAVDMYMDTSLPEPAVSAGVAASAEAAEMDVVGSVLSKARIFKIPEIVPRFYSIPIALTSTETEPGKGEFRRIGMDCAVNGTWLAYKWALDDRNEDAKEALEKPILNWPFDFKLFEDRLGDASGSAVEDAILEAMINIPLETERLRDFFGLEGKNLVNICMKVRDLLREQKTSKAVPTIKEVHTWMSTHVRWGLYRQPTEKTVKKLLANGDMISSNAAASEIIDRALIKFGRDNFFDYPTKLNTLVHKCGSHADLTFTCRWVFAHMQRRQLKDPFSDSQLEGKTGIVAQCQWMRRYAEELVNNHPRMFVKPNLAASAELPLAASAGLPGAPKVDLWAQAKRLILDPLALYDFLEGPQRSVTWLASVPTEALRLAVDHMRDLFGSYYMSELKGALAKYNAGQYPTENFQETERVKTRFMADFSEACKKLQRRGPEETEQEGARQCQGNQSALADSAGAQGDGQPAQMPQETDKSQFRREVEARVEQELSARMVVLTRDGNHDELTKNVTATELYQNLESTGCRFMGVYDTKNARLCDVFVGEGLSQREPCVDEEDLQAFCTTMNNIMKANTDVCWILGGRIESNTKIIRDTINKQGWKSKEFVMITDYKGMQKHYWRRQRGLANSRSVERLYFCWRGRMPKNIPSERWYVDQGSPLYVEVMFKVPVVPPKELTFVSKTVREASLKRMAAPPAPGGAADAEDLAEDGEGGPTRQELLQHVKRRRLYRQSTGTDEVWFPHDNPIPLMKELVWEAGGDHVKWVLCGTPAAGNGVAGVLHMGGHLSRWGCVCLRT